MCGTAACRGPAQSPSETTIPLRAGYECGLAAECLAGRSEAFGLAARGAVT